MNELKLANPNSVAPSKAEMFVATRKRKEGREYLTKPDVMNYRISEIQKLCASGAPTESVDQLLIGESSHGDSWLIGRHVLLKKSKLKACTYKDEVARIRSQLQEEMEEKLNAEMDSLMQLQEEKLNKKMSSFIQKLEEKNPNLDLGECSSSEDGSVSF